MDGAGQKSKFIKISTDKIENFPFITKLKKKKKSTLMKVEIVNIRRENSILNLSFFFPLSL